MRGKGLNLLDLFAILFLTFCISSCSEEVVTQTPSNPDQWSIPKSEIIEGGPGKDDIRSIDEGVYVHISEIQTLANEDLVVILTDNGSTKVYPHGVLDWHEIVNDSIGTLKYALTYCPLTGTASAWNRIIEGTETSFGVSGKLYNSNLIPFDRLTDSNWSQLALKCVNGPLNNRNIQQYPIMETSWESCKMLFPDALVLTTDTGFDRPYNEYPYNDYRTNNQYFLFPVNPLDDRLPAKERVLGVFSNSIKKAYRFADFIEPRVVSEQYGGQKYLILGSKVHNILVAFKDPGFVNPHLVLENLSIMVKDDLGNVMDVSGNILEGPIEGKRLDQAKSIAGYWFSLAAFYPDIQIANP